MKSLLLALAMVGSAHADPPVSLAWNLRSVGVSSAIRADTAVGTFTDSGASGQTVASVWTFSYKITAHLAPLVRVAVTDNMPAMGASATAISNPLFGLVWAPRLSAHWKYAMLGGVTMPVGSGGGDDGNPARAAAQKAAVFARSAMDNSLFAVNDVTPVIGVDLAFAAGGFTIQGEATLFELVRERGGTVDPDKYKTNFTSGGHLGYFLLPWLCASAELRYQRYLSTPAAVAMKPATRDNLTVAGGLRAVIKLGHGRLLRPGVSYARGLDDPMNARHYQIFQLDLPLSF